MMTVKIEGLQKKKEEESPPLQPTLPIFLRFIGDGKNIETSDHKLHLI
jgi:hypothetical protein